MGSSEAADTRCRREAVRSDIPTQKCEAVELGCTCVRTMIDEVVRSDRLVEYVVKGIRALTDSRIKSSKIGVTGRSYSKSWIEEQISISEAPVRGFKADDSVIVHALA